MCESAIKVPHNSLHLCACFVINSCSLCLNFLNLFYNCSTIEQLVTSRFKLSIAALQIGGTKLSRDSLSTDTKLVTTTSKD